MGEIFHIDRDHPPQFNGDGGNIEKMILHGGTRRRNGEMYIAASRVIQQIHFLCGVFRREKKSRKL